MGSTVAAMAFGALAMGAGTSGSPAQASISPEERGGPVQTYRIPSGSMGAALNTFADKSGLHVLYESRVTERLKTPGLSGSYSVRDGLARLLSGSGLSYRIAENGRAVSIMLAQNDTGAQTNAVPAGAEPLPTIDVGAARPVAGGPGEGQGTSPGIAGLGALDSNSGDRLTGYSAPNAVSAMKVDTPVLQTPVSVQTVTRQTIDDQAATDIQDAIVNNTSSVFAYGRNQSNFFIRGFAQYNGQIYVNGLSTNSSIYAFDMSNVEFFEVLKGPASILYGRADPGGIVIANLKRPLETPYWSVWEQAGSYGETRTQVDMTGPLTSDKTWLYRINATYERQGSFIDYSQGVNKFLDFTLTYHPNDQFRLNMDAQYADTKNVFQSGGIAIGNKPAGIPISTFLGDPAVGTDPSRQQRLWLGFDWKYEFNKDWNLSQKFRYAEGHGELNQSGPVGLPDIYGTTPIAGFTTTGSEFDFNSNLDLNGKFYTWGAKHEALIGADFFHSYSPVSTAYTPNGPEMQNIYFPKAAVFTYYDPNTGAPTNISLPMPLYNNPLYTTLYWQGLQRSWSGLYGQDKISIYDDRIHFLLGGRYDWAEERAAYSYNGRDLSSASTNGAFDQAFSPRLGVVLEPLPWFSVYGSYQKSFGQNHAITGAGQVLPPEKGMQWEGGVKAELLDKRLIATAAYFWILKKNVEYPDPLNPTFGELIPGQTSEGVEASLTGKIDQNWSLIANYSHTDTRITQISQQAPLDPTVEVVEELPRLGAHLAAVPTDSGNIWLKYDADGIYKGLSVAGGAFIAGSAVGDNAGSYQLPAYRIFNGMIGYSFPWEDSKVTMQLNIKNIFDSRYYTNSYGFGRTTIIPGDPRTIYATMRLEHADKAQSVRGIFDELLPTRGKQPLEHDWSGIYFGGSGVWGALQSSSTTGYESVYSFAPGAIWMPGTYGGQTGEAWTFSAPTPSGFGGGGQIGVNAQFLDRVVVGFEGDLQSLHLNGTSGGVGAGAFDVNTGNLYSPVVSLNQAIDWYGTARARIGYSVLPTLLLYGTGGYAVARTRGGFNYLDTRGNTAQWTIPATVAQGWSFGGGLEWSFLPNWSLKVEYLNADFFLTRASGVQPYAPIAEVGPAASGPNANNFGIQQSSLNNHISSVKVGLNYHFGGMKAADIFPESVAAKPEAVTRGHGGLTQEVVEQAAQLQGGQHSQRLNSNVTQRGY